MAIDPRIKIESSSTPTAQASGSSQQLPRQRNRRMRNNEGGHVDTVFVNQSGATPPEEERDAPRRPKSRAPKACQYCRKTKKRCSGSRTCNNCKDVRVVCDYGPFATTEARLAFEEIQRKQEEEDQEEFLRSRGINLQQAGMMTFSWRNDHQGPNAGPASRPTTADQAPPAPASPAMTLVGDDEAPRLDCADLEPLEPADKLADAMKDMCIHATGGFVGGSSQIVMGRTMDDILQNPSNSSSRAPGARSMKFPSRTDRGKGADYGGHQHYQPASHLTPGGFTSVGSSPHGLDLDPFAWIADHVADMLIESYMTHVSTLWPILSGAQVQKLHAQRRLLGPDDFETAILHLIYAVGGRVREATGQLTDFSPAIHHQQALAMYDDMLSRYRSMPIASAVRIQLVRIQLLLATYSLRNAGGRGAWDFIRPAMSLCIELGLHRPQPPTSQLPPQEIEAQKMLFWTCYCLDRQVSIVLGRPFSIDDADIDVDYPQHLDLPDLEDAYLPGSAHYGEDWPIVRDEAQSRALDIFVHVCRLRVIESRIKQTIYRVNPPISAAAMREQIGAFLSELDHWKDEIPMDGSHYCLLQNTLYFTAVRFLLFPLVLTVQLERPYDPDMLRQAAETCTGICQTYRTLHRNHHVAFTLMAMQDVFYAGLTLLYASWVCSASPAASSSEVVATIVKYIDEGLNAAEGVLDIISERWRGASRYRDRLVETKEKISSMIARKQRSRPEPASAVGGGEAMPETLARLQNAGAGRTYQEFFGDFEDGDDTDVEDSRMQMHHEGGGYAGAQFVPQTVQVESPAAAFSTEPRRQSHFEYYNGPQKSFETTPVEVAPPPHSEQRGPHPPVHMMSPPVPTPLPSHVSFSNNGFGMTPAGYPPAPEQQQQHPFSPDGSMMMSPMANHHHHNHGGAGGDYQMDMGAFDAGVQWMEPVYGDASYNWNGQH